LITEQERFDFDHEVRRLVSSLPRRSRPRGYRQVLLAYDGSSGARAALERVAALASPQTVVTVITVIPFESVGSSTDPIKPEQRDWQWSALVEAVALLEQRGIGAFIEAAAGNPAPVILEVARTLNADLVALGRGRERRWRPSMKRRSVRRSLLPKLICDALVVAPNKQSAPRPPLFQAAAQGKAISPVSVSARNLVSYAKSADSDRDPRCIARVVMDSPP
jgi:nucleotide-binding universal stress UspA family protein